MSSPARRAARPAALALSWLVAGVAAAEEPAAEAVAAEAVADDEATIVVTSTKNRESAAVLLEERKEASAVTEVLGAEQMSRSGDSSAAAAVRRVTGLTVVDGRFVYVRGLGERYAVSTLNGSSLPSPEPERRVVPLDLFPAGILSSVTVQKTYSPDLPAEFGGGVVQLRTKDIPEEPTFGVALSGTYAHGTTFTRGPDGPRGPTDLFGMDNGFRALPAAVAGTDALEESDRFSDDGYTAAELEAYGEAFPNHWRVGRRVAPPDHGLTLYAGDGVSVGPHRLGVYAAGLYGDTWDHDVYERTYYTVGGGGALEPAHTYRFDTLARNVQLGGLVDVGARLAGTSEIRVTSVLNRNTDDETRLYEGYNRDVDGDIRSARLRWVERQLLFEQVRGSHTVTPAALEVDWRYTYAWATRLEPERLEYRQDYEASTGEWLLSNRPGGNELVYSDLTDHNHDAGVDFTLPIATRAGDSAVRIGFAAVSRDREVDTRRFTFTNAGARASDPAVLASDPSEIFVAENIGADGFRIEEATRPTDNYTASQVLNAAYAMADVTVLAPLRVMAGARVERSEQIVTTFERFDAEATPVVARLHDTDVLPAATITTSLTDAMLVRVGYGRTVNRPDFRELSPATFDDVTGGRQTYGNPDLVRAVIDHADARWEWYPADGESLSVGGFYKRFTDPIETIVVVSAQHSVTWANALGADNYGVELDWRKHLPVAALPGLYTAGNVALIRSRVRIDPDAGIQTSDERPLQGQSPYVVNVHLGWESERGTNVAVLYNVCGPRIAEVGALGAPDTYEMPFHQLDVIGSHPLGRGFGVGIRAKNLLDSPRRVVAGDALVERWREGFSVGAQVSWKPG